MTLLDYINVAYRQYKEGRGLSSRFTNVEEFIFSDNKCIDLISHSLDINPSSLYGRTIVNSHRASHILLTFLLGQGIGKDLHIIDNVNIVNQMPNEYLWMITSVIHDYGYLQQEVHGSNELHQICGKYDLLADTNNVSGIECLENFSEHYPMYMFHSYDTIKKYYSYRKDTLTGYDEPLKERIDHGILGGCKCFAEYMEFYVDQASTRAHVDPIIQGLMLSEPALYKAACVTTAQHNIFKSSDFATDVVYRNYGLDDLCSDETRKINRHYPLLYLLSIVDTIEPAKRFAASKCKLKQLLSRTYIQTNDCEIIIDFSEFIQHLCCKSRNIYGDIIERHIQGIVSLDNWLDCDVEMTGDYAIKITLGI